MKVLVELYKRDTITLENLSLEVYRKVGEESIELDDATASKILSNEDTALSWLASIASHYKADFVKARFALDGTVQEFAYAKPQHTRGATPLVISPTLSKVQKLYLVKTSSSTSPGAGSTSQEGNSSESVVMLDRELVVSESQKPDGSVEIKTLDLTSQECYVFENSIHGSLDQNATLILNLDDAISFVDSKTLQSLQQSLQTESTSSKKTTSSRSRTKTRKRKRRKSRKSSKKRSSSS